MTDALKEVAVDFFQACYHTDLPQSDLSKTKWMLAWAWLCLAPALLSVSSTVLEFFLMLFSSKAIWDCCFEWMFPEMHSAAVFLKEKTNVKYKVLYLLLTKSTFFFPFKTEFFKTLCLHGLPVCHFLNMTSTVCNRRNSLFHVVTGFTGEYVMSGLCKEQASSLFSQELQK